MSRLAHGGAVVAELVKAGHRLAEVYLKEGRSRRFEMGPRGVVCGRSQESGWAVRAGGPSGSFGVCGTGLPALGHEWPVSVGAALSLPRAHPIPSWSEPASFDSPLIAESSALSLLGALQDSLGAEVAGARIQWAVLEDGTNQVDIANSRGIRCSHRGRASSLVVEAVGPWDASPGTRLYLAQPAARDFQPELIAQRLANRLLLAHKGEAAETATGEILLAPAVASEMVAALAPYLVGREASELVRELSAEQGRLGSEQWTIIDNGRLPGGVLEAPVDGEGSPTRRLDLVEGGHYRGNLEPWPQTGGRDRGSGCMRRPGWRDWPRVSPSHFYVAPHGSNAVSDLLASISAGHYLVEPRGPAVVDSRAKTLSLKAVGFAVRKGRATTPISSIRLERGLGSLLHGLRARGRDLTFQPLRGMIGAPTLLIAGTD